MSKLPQLNLRIPEQHHPLVRRLAECLRERTGDAFAAELTAFLEDRPALDYGSTDNVAVAVGELAARVAELEQWRQSLTDPEPLRESWAEPAVIERPKNEYISETICSQANALKRKGMTWEAVWKTLGEPATVNGLRNAVGKWRKRYHVKAED
jgi:hypothetical protein